MSSVILRRDASGSALLLLSPRPTASLTLILDSTSALLFSSNMVKMFVGRLGHESKSQRTRGTYLESPVKEQLNFLPSQDDQMERGSTYFQFKVKNFDQKKIN